MQVREEAERPRTPLVAFFSILLSQPRGLRLRGPAVLVGAQWVACDGSSGARGSARTTTDATRHPAPIRGRASL